MTTKKSRKPATLQTILTAVERGFAAAAEDIVEIKSTMATKDDIAGIMEELGDIKQRLRAVEAAVEDHAGHSKEIDHALERIAAIERHLGITKKIAA